VRDRNNRGNSSPPELGAPVGDGNQSPIPEVNGMSPVEDAKAPRTPSAPELLRARRSLATERPERGRVLVVDDSDVFLRIAASVISDTCTLRLVGAVESGEEAIRLLSQLQPDLVVVDRNMPGIDGVQTTRIIRREKPQTVVIMVSAELIGLSDVARAAGASATLDKRDFLPRTLDALWLEHMRDGR
jgi:CheY-like chemotaxis protein